MIECITSRKGKEFEKMMTMWRWCDEKFGQANWLVTWTGDFASGHTDDWVAFKFYDEKLATWFKLQFPETLSRQEFEDMRLYGDIYES